MKKIIITVFAMILVANTVYGRIFGLGIKGGVDMPKLSTDIAAASSNLSFGGGHAGLMAEFNIPIVGIGIQPELLYVNKKVSGMKDRTSLLEVPINLSWGIGLPVLDMRVFGVVAPTFSYAFKAMELDKATVPTTFKQNNWAIGLGAGLDIWKLQLMVKWKWGIGDMVDKAKTSGEIPNLKENTLTVSLGYFIF